MAKICLLLLILLQGVFVTPVQSSAITNHAGEVKQNGVIHLPATDALQLIKDNSEIVILDVRTPVEFNYGHIAGAININYYSFSFKKQIAALDPEKTYLVHCATGVRSGRSIPILLEAGFTNLIHMDGGFKLWQQSGHPILK